jgi:hypothetical protein
MIDPLDELSAELVADTSVSTERIRRFEPWPDDVRGPGAYLKFVVLVRLDSSRELGRLPVQHVPVVARCYAASDYDAVQLAGQVSDAVHNRGPRGTPARIYRSFAPSDGGIQKDPDTGQPYVEVTITLHAATVAVA